MRIRRFPILFRDGVTLSLRAAFRRDRWLGWMPAREQRARRRMGA